MLDSIFGLSPVILTVLAILVFFSLMSWTLIVQKYLLTSRARKQTKEFLDLFWETKEFPLIWDKLQSSHPDLAGSSLGLLFQEGYRETEHFLGQESSVTAPLTLSTDLNAIENISRTLRKVSAREISKLEKNTSFLATTASTTPFIGLFGTVWGIMNAFQNIGEAGSTSLAIVAPGISEALVTTAIGLAVAIPAVIGFNVIQSRIRGVVSEIDNFCFDYLNIVQKLFHAKR